MAASASTNPAATVACFLLLLLALVVVAAGAREGSSLALAPQEADGGAGTITFDTTIPRASLRCHSDPRWNEQLCRTVCGMFKFHGYEFTADAVTGQDAAPRCCCCPKGYRCLQL